MKKIIYITLLLILFSHFSFSKIPEKNYTNFDLKNIKNPGFLILHSGAAMKIENTSDNILVGGLAFERFSSSIFSWNYSINVWGSSPILPYFSVDALIHPFRKKTFDPYIGLGILLGFQDDVQYLDFPLTLGFNLWLSQNFGFKIQAKTFIGSFTQDPILELNLGLIIGLF